MFDAEGLTRRVVVCTHVRHDATTSAGPPCPRRLHRSGSRRLRIGQTGTEFAPDRENRLDAGLASLQGRPDAAPGEEASHEVPRDLGAAAAMDASPPGMATEDSSPEAAQSTQDSESSDDASYEAASTGDAAIAPDDGAAPARVSS